MKTFHNSQEIKDKYVNRLKEHRRLEHLVQGLGWETRTNGDAKGCAVGCTLENYSHKAYETELGIPEWLARLEDYLFEQLPKDKAEEFAVKFLEVIPIGVDLKSIRHQLGILVQEQNLEIIKDNKESYAEECRSAINLVIAWHKFMLTNTSAAEAAWSAAKTAESAARSAARSAEAAWPARSARSAWSAAETAMSAACSAAETAMSAACSAAETARAAAWSAAWSARSARPAYIEWEANTLLELLSKA